VIKYNSSGTKQWTKLLGVSGKYSEAYGIAIDTSNNIYIAGYTNGTLDGNTLAGTYDLFITKFNSSGTKQWTKLLGVSGKTTYAFGVAVDSGSNIYITGYTNGNLDGNTLTGTTDFFITMYNSSGTKQWTKQLGVSGKNTYAYGITVDSASNAYVTGYTLGGLDGNTLTGLYDLYISKFDSSGAKQWTTLLGVSGAVTSANGITVDSASNIFVTGNTAGGLDGNTLAGINDLFITKYNTSGTKQWTKQLGVSGASTKGSGITVDSLNNIHVTGGTTGGLDGNSLMGGRDLIVTKYNSSGTKQWTEQLGTNIGPAATYAYGIAADSANNLYVTGYTNGGLDGNSPMGYQDLFVTKYNSIGSKQWTKQLGASIHETFAYAVATDSSNHIYVIGYTTGDLDGNTLTGSQDFFVTQYNSNGDKQWTRQMGVNTRFTQAISVATDSTNNVYVTGNTSGGLDGNSLTGNNDIFVTKYDVSGSKQWTKQLGVSTLDTYASSIKIDSAGDICITGFTDGGLDGNTLMGLSDFFVTKYNSSGTKLWTTQLGVSGKTTSTNSIAVDSANNIYLTGSTNGGLDGNTLTGTSDTFITKYNSNGTKIWTKQFGASAADAYANAIAVDSANNIYVTGYTSGSLDGNTRTGPYDTFVAKYNSSGTKLWTKQFGVSGKLTYAFGMTVDTAKNIFITGTTYGGLDGNILTGTSDFIVIKYNSDGVKQ
jgi:outer membrane protein assembly factor BamB